MYTYIHIYAQTYIPTYTLLSMCRIAIVDATGVSIELNLVVNALMESSKDLALAGRRNDFMDLGTLLCT